MTTNFPSSIDNFTNPTTSDTLASVSHSAQHADVNDAVEALEAKVGVDGSAVTSSLDYKVAQQGLTFIKSQTIGSGVASVTVTGAFSSTFENYRIVVSGIDCSVGLGNQLQFGLGSTTLSMYGSFYYDKYDGSSTGTGRFTATTTMSCAMQAVNSNTGFVMDIQRPYKNTRTNWSGQYNGEGWSGWYGGTNTVASAQTSFYLSSAGTMTGGTIRVYGYNNG